MESSAFKPETFPQGRVTRCSALPQRLPENPSLGWQREPLRSGFKRCLLVTSHSQALCQQRGHGHKQPAPSGLEGRTRTRRQRLPGPLGPSAHRVPLCPPSAHAPIRGYVGQNISSKIDLCARSRWRVRAAPRYQLPDAPAGADEGPGAATGDARTLRGTCCHRFQGRRGTGNHP